MLRRAEQTVMVNIKHTGPQLSPVRYGDVEFKFGPRVLELDSEDVTQATRRLPVAGAGLCVSLKKERGTRTLTDASHTVIHPPPKARNYTY